MVLRRNTTIGICALRDKQKLQHQVKDDQLMELDHQTSITARRRTDRDECETATPTRDKNDVGC